MFYRDIDISKKCKNICIDNPLIGATSSKVNGAGKYGYCKHYYLLGYWIGKVNYGGKPLKIVDDTKGNTTKLFNNTYSILDEIVIYYNTDHDSSVTIRIPLLLGVKEHKHGGYHWYENLSKDNLTWKEISGTHNFPRNDTESVGDDFKTKLDNLTCTLHKLHGADIRKTVNNGGSPYICSVCNKAKLLLTVEIPGQTVDCYKKFYHTPQDDEGKIIYPVTYENELIKYQEPGGSKFTLLEVTKNATLSVYYWEGDSDYENPLLMEVKSSGKGSTWYENTGDFSKKHDKWRKLKQNETTKLSNYGEELKKKLDLLSCALNKAVRIHLGRDSGCHDSRDSKHNNRISTRHNGIFNKGLSLSAYEYKSRVSGEKFSVAEILIHGERQKTGSGNLLFKDIKKLVAYESNCSPGSPFLIRVEFGSGNTKWYERKYINTWKEYNNFSGKFINTLEEAARNLKINKCPPPEPLHKGLKIDISQQPKNDTLTNTYRSTHGSQVISIFVTRDAKTFPHGFFRVTHQTTTGAPFNLSRDLGKGGSIRATAGTQGTPIDNVEEVAVYYWDGASNIPILIEIKKGGEKPKYYSYSLTTGKIDQGRWIQGSYKNLTDADLNFMLDDQNCQRNNAIPFDIKEPIKDHAGGKSNSLKTREIKESNSMSPPIPPSSDYIVQEYTINGGGAKISRVTYGGKDTTIGAIKDTVTQLRIYQWKGEDTPLLVEFIGDSNQHIFFENTNVSSLNWMKVKDEDSQKFYKNTSPQKDLTDRLDEASCRVHHTVKINISNRGSPDKYCHDRCIPNRIKVNAKKNIPGYSIYEHTSNIYRGVFTVTSIIKNGHEHQVEGHPLYNVKKVTVYFSECTGDYPVAIRVQKGKDELWLKDETVNGQWMSFNPKGDKSDILTCQKGSRSPTIQEPSVPSEDDSSDSDEESQDGNPGDGNFSGYFDWYWESLVSSLAGAMIDGPPQAVRAIAETLFSLKTRPDPHQATGTPVKQEDLPAPEATSQKPPQHAALTAGLASAPGGLKDPPVPSKTDPKTSTPNPTDIKTISISTSSVLGTSALACFTGWKLYNRYKGDPWVRQI